MFRILMFIAIASLISTPLKAQPHRHGEIQSGKQPHAWDSQVQEWVTIEQFWKNYGQSRGGITWGEAAEYPTYSKVKEHDTFMVKLDSGLCLMEFFHGRWRRANDVKRWNPGFNDFGACPHVFD